jgi:dihydropyrimidine dehydrogenase (NAD+) subunit PreA
LVLFYTACVKHAVDIPVIPKMTPNITHISQPSMASFFAGADAISAINTIKSVTMDSRSEVNGYKCVSGLSGRAVKPIAQRFILELANHLILNNPAQFGRTVELSGIGGIETWRDALEYIELGCRNVQVCTAVMQYGQRIINDLTLGLQNYMADNGIEKLDDLVGRQLPTFMAASDMDRDTIVYPKVDREKCIGCGRCYIACRDGGHLALSFGEDRQPRLDGTKCVGCHLCRLVCPSGAVSSGNRVLKRR